MNTPDEHMSRVDGYGIAALAGQPESRSLRVALIAAPYLPIPPQSYGAVERIVVVPARGLTAHGHDVTLLGAPRE